MKTIKEVAETLNVSKNSLEKRLKREPLKSLMNGHIHSHDYSHGTAKVIDEKGMDIINKAYSETQTTATAIPPTIAMTTATAIDKTLEILQEQLKIKDSEIDRLHEQIIQAQKELAVEREHNRTQAEKLIVITDHAQQLQAHMQQQTTEKKPKLLERLFKKKKQNEDNKEDL